MKLFKSFLFAVALAQAPTESSEPVTGLEERGRKKKNKNPVYTTLPPTTTIAPTTPEPTTTEEPTTTSTTTTTEAITTTTEAADVTTTPYAPPAAYEPAQTEAAQTYQPAQTEEQYTDYKPDNSNAVVAAILNDVVANRPLRPDSDEEAAELARKAAQPDFSRYCWRCTVGGNYPLTKAGLAEAQNKCVMEGHIDVCYRGNNGCYTETRLSPGKDGETFLTMVDMGCQDYDQCKASQSASGMFNYKNPQCKPNGKQSHCKNCCEGEKQCNLAFVARRGLNQQDISEWQNHERSLSASLE